MDFINVYSKGCFNCHYIELLMKKLNIFDKIKQVEKDSINGINLVDKYNINSVPTLLVFNSDLLVEKYENIEKPLLENFKRKYQL